jgi:anionic cell wall polymer biosynthesis LytR-Cps2A-Psr (LCP) family protein
MDGISKIADAVGGVEVTLDSTIPDVGKKGQKVLLKGEKAETYLRDRHNTSGSDFGRTAHQRDFMILLAKKIKSMGAVESITKLWNEFNSFGKTDLNLDQALAFAKLLSVMDIDAIQQLAIPANSAMWEMPACFLKTRLKRSICCSAFITKRFHKPNMKSPLRMRGFFLCVKEPAL